MPGIRRASVSVAALAVSGLLLAGCGGSSTTSGDKGPSVSGALVIDTSFNLKTADPGRMFEPTGNLVLRPVYDTLVTFKGGDVTKVVPSLAELPVVSADGKKFTFTLKSGVKFSDGTPLSAKDVVFTLNRVKNLKGNPSFLLDGVTAAAEGDSTVVLTTAKADPGLPFRLANPALGVLNATAVKANGGTDAVGADKTDKAEAWLGEHSQGSGPYVVKSYSATTEVVLEANPNYWGAKPKYAKVVVRNTPASTQQLNVAQGASQLALDLSPDQTSGVEGKATVLKTPSANVGFLLVNANPAVSKVTANPQFAEAVRYGVDYEGILKVTGEGSSQAVGVIPSTFAAALPKEQAVKRDVARAKAALAKSGITDPRVDLSYPSDIQINGVDLGDVAAKVQASLKDVGITVNLKPAPVQSALDTYRKGTEQLGLWWWGPDFPDASDYLVFAPGQLVGLRAGWKSDPTISGLATAAEKAVEPAARVTAYQEYQKALNTGGPFVPLFQPAQVIASAKNLGGVHYNPIWFVDINELS
jgi:peptide/nickel transport system substrate-binding protein